MYCSTCRCELPAVARFCVECGSRVEFAPSGSPPVKTEKTATMFCVYCGHPYESGHHFCNFCGHQLPDLTEIEARGERVEARAPTPNFKPYLEAAGAVLSPDFNSAADKVSGPVAPHDGELEKLRAENPNLIGIGGWLAWFCVVVTFVSPLIFLVELANSKDPVVWGLDIALTAWYVFTGITLWREGKQALKYVLILLIVQSCVGVLAIIGSFTGYPFSQ